MPFPIAALQGLLSKKQGSDALALLTKEPKHAYFLLGIEPEFDCAVPAAALKSLQEAGLVVCLSSFMTPTMENYADFILPVTPPTEMSGTFVNTEGVWQKFAAVSVPKAKLSRLGKFVVSWLISMKLPGFDYEDIQRSSRGIASFGG